MPHLPGNLPEVVIANPSSRSSGDPEPSLAQKGNFGGLSQLCFVRPVLRKGGKSRANSNDSTRKPYKFMGFRFPVILAA